MNGPSFSSRKGKRRPTMPSGDIGLNGNPGKGDAPRNCFSSQFRNNYDRIDWGLQPQRPPGSSQPRIPSFRKIVYSRILPRNE
jgi:hypothetical protein